MGESVLITVYEILVTSVSSTVFEPPIYANQNSNPEQNTKHDQKDLTNGLPYTFKRRWSSYNTGQIDHAPYEQTAPSNHGAKNQRCHNQDGAKAETE